MAGSVGVVSFKKYSTPAIVAHLVQFVGKPEHSTHGDVHLTHCVLSVDMTSPAGHVDRHTLVPNCLTDPPSVQLSQ